MPIKRFENRPASFPIIGALRKGGPQRTQVRNGRETKIMGVDLKGFRFDTKDAAALADFKAVYGDEPTAVTVLLPHPAVDDNWQEWQEAWTGTRLVHRCDGEFCYEPDPASGQIVKTETPCPDRDKPETDKNRCRPVGRLMLIIPALRRFAWVRLETHSIHDIINIRAHLESVAGLRSGQVNSVPLRLYRVAREISTPDGKGGRLRTTKHLISIEIDPGIAALQLESMAAQARALAAGPALALPAPTVTNVYNGAPPLPMLTSGAQEPAQAPTAPLWNDGPAEDGDFVEDEDEAPELAEADSHFAAEEAKAVHDRKISELNALWTACEQRGKQLPDDHRKLVLTEQSDAKLDMLIAQATRWLDRLVKAESPQPA